jgi:hypothetical protein
MASSTPTSSLRAGFGHCNLTPLKPCFLVGYPHVERTATGQHDPLLASALVLENNGERQVFISIDWLFVSAEWTRKCRDAISVATGITPGAIMIGATHTHSGPHTAEVLAWRDDPVVPTVDQTYLQDSLQKVVAAVTEAVNDLHPVSASWIKAKVRGIAGGNRIDPNGAEDPEAGLLVVREVGSDKIHSILSIYGMHPTVLHEDSTFYSADFIHFTRRYLQRAFPGVGVIYLNGVCGNQSPRRAVKAQTFAEADRIGTALGVRMAAEILNQRTAEQHTHLPLKALSTSLTIQGKNFPDIKAAEANLQAAREHYQQLKESAAEHSVVRTAECTVFGAEEVYTLAKAETDGSAEALRQRYANAEIQVFQVGACAVTAWPGEFFVEYALELKQQSPLPVFPVTMANGELQGYVVTPEAEAANGYEAQMSLFPAAGGKQFISATLELLNQLQPPASK